MRLSDRDHPFYKPLWRRIAIVSLVGLWAVVELLAGGDSLWITLSLICFGYALWAYILTFPRN